MKMTSLWMHIPAIIVICLIVAACSGSTPGGPRLVEVWRGGDDALTMKLKDALEIALKSSPDFALSTGRKPGTLLVVIPSHINGKQAGGRTQILYTAEFASIDDKRIGASTGSCWDDGLTKCTAQIMKDAKVAARKIR